LRSRSRLGEVIYAFVRSDLHERRRLLMDDWSEYLGRNGR